jgi:hypothetical protein
VPVDALVVLAQFALARRCSPAARWRQTAATLVDAAVPSDPEVPAAWAACAALLPHARAVLDLTSSGIWSIGCYLGESGAYRAALELFRQITGRTPLDSIQP